MDIFAICILITLVFLALNQPNVPVSGSQPTVSTNVITYPSEKKCNHCGNEEFNLMYDIDSSTWDIICPKCKEIAYKHPKREERKEQIDDMLDM